MANLVENVRDNMATAGIGKPVKPPEGTHFDFSDFIILSKKTKLDHLGDGQKAAGGSGISAEAAQVADSGFAPGDMFRCGKLDKYNSAEREAYQQSVSRWRAGTNGTFKLRPTCRFQNVRSWFHECPWSNGRDVSGENEHESDGTMTGGQFSSALQHRSAHRPPGTIGRKRPSMHLPGYRINLNQSTFLANSFSNAGSCNPETSNVTAMAMDIPSE
ncbi:hypothetical protein pipiens_019933 [Culex pipiens pipiens]|uniref:Uncharacterized protein n=1 Tax=Culex pipiens pipiens TaxID=38569 RepID=A0ABD1DQ53_CULPP